MEEEADPVAGLFANDRIVPAPGINDSPSEAEIGRWVATAHTSLFDDRVKDPVPAPPEPVASVGSEPRRRPSAPEVVRLDQPPIPGMTEPLLAPRKPRSAAAAPAPAPAAEAPAGEPLAAPANVRAGSASGARKRAALVPAASAATDRESNAGEGDAPASKARKRRVERGPSRVMLAGLGAATLSALGIAVALLGIVPNPLGSSAAPAAPVVKARIAAPVRAPAKPKAATPVAAATKKAELAALAPTAVVKPSVPAPKAVTPPTTAQAAPPPVAPVVAAPTATAPRPTAVPVVEAAPVVAGASASESEEDEASHSGPKLAQARRLLSAEDPEGAEAIARQVLSGDAQDHHAMDVLARALMDQDRGAEAVPLARAMVQRRAKRVPYRLLLGDLLLMVGKEADARAQWRVALELAPNDLEIKRRLNN